MISRGVKKKSRDANPKVTATTTEMKVQRPLRGFFCADLSSIESLF